MVIQMIVIMLLEMTLLMIMTKNGGTCSKCDNIFKTESDLTLHIEMQHDDDNDKLGEVKKNKPKMAYSRDAFTR